MIYGRYEELPDNPEYQAKRQLAWSLLQRQPVWWEPGYVKTILAGTESRFVGLMNRRARRLGLRCTRFADSHGLSAGDRSCPRDLAVLTRLAMANRRIAHVVRRRQVSFHFPIKGGRLFLNGHNPLIRAGYRGAIGLKTGYTAKAGRCLVGVARRRGRTLGVVLLHSPNPLKHAAALLNEGFAQG